MLSEHDLQYTANVFGLQNNANLCYLNSLVQALCSCPSFVKTILDNEDEFKQTSELGNCLVSLMSKYTNHTTFPTYRNIKVEDIGNLLRLIQSARVSAGHKATLGNGTQEDVFEGFKFLIESLGESIKKIKNTDVDDFQNLFSVRYKLTIRCTACGNVRGVDQESCPSEIAINMSESKSILHGVLDSQQTIEKYIRMHMLYPEDYKCEKCNFKNTANSSQVQQIYTLARVSSIIVMSFHDNQQIMYNKNGVRKVRYFPNELKITSKLGVLLYRPVAQVEHFGNLGGGHYTAKCLRPRPDGFSEIRVSSAKKVIEDSQERLKLTQNDERKLILNEKLKQANRVIEEEKMLNNLPSDDFQRQYATFKFNDSHVTYDPNGFYPTQQTYIVFYHLFSNSS